MYEKMIDAELHRKKAADVIGTPIRSKIRDSRGSKNIIAQRFYKVMPIKLPLSYDPGPLERVMHPF